LQALGRGREFRGPRRAESPKGGGLIARYATELSQLGQSRRFRADEGERHAG
jgi:hypothetical protein